MEFGRRLAVVRLYISGWQSKKKFKDLAPFQIREFPFIVPINSLPRRGGHSDEDRWNECNQKCDLSPYAVAIAELTDGTRMMAQLTDCNVEDVKIGGEVRLEFRRVQSEERSGVISHGHKFVPKWY